MTTMTATVPTALAAAAEPTHHLLVRTMTWVVPGVVALTLEAPDGAALPQWTPGAHIDVHLPNGVVRQYSLSGDPADRHSYRIAVREIEFGRASGVVHRELRPGAVIEVGMPRNNFPLIDAERYLFVAGGIGITPLLPMMRSATAAERPWTLLFCTRREGDAPFLAEARALGGTVVVHANEAGTRLDVMDRLAMAEEGAVLYCCGPESLMRAVEAATSAWPEDTVRFEWFAPPSESEAQAAGSFDVVCARSAKVLTVEAHETLLGALLGAGVPVAHSCEQGVCGTCEVRVIEGEIDHRDAILSAAERRAGRSMMSCVSRAAGARLVLDL